MVMACYGGDSSFLCISSRGYKELTMNVNHTMSPVRKAVLGLLVPLIYTSSVMATESAFEITPDAGVTPYIVNGSNASVTDFPSMASLFIDRIDYDGVYSTGPYCGWPLV
eukprot:TRINITY_DN108_c0_g2_i2.p1 TRINITY_DN108_c0_g2~~TRINITY_DN108_c0_g2_i2.p1  ORF type:complete len:110 (-),score=7.75 TRINITY_DN108_c0_g2_i2:29-358(-)